MEGPVMHRPCQARYGHSIINSRFIKSQRVQFIYLAVSVTHFVKHVIIRHIVAQLYCRKFRASYPQYKISMS